MKETHDEIMKLMEKYPPVKLTVPDDPFEEVCKTMNRLIKSIDKLNKTLKEKK